MAGHHLPRSPIMEDIMKLSNIINFVKAGYTPAEIAGMENADAVSQLLQEGIKKEDVPAYLDLLKDDPEPEETPEKDKVRQSEEDEPDNDPTDYKEKYNTLLKKTQEAAVRQNMKPEEKSSDEILADIVKSFM